MNKRIFLYTHVMLDLPGERVPFYDTIAQLKTLADQRKINLIVSPNSFVTINYFLSKDNGISIAKDKLRKFKILCEISKVDENIIEKGLNSDFKYFEDSSQYFSAIKTKSEVIINRNPKNFKHSLLPIMSAEEYLASIL